MPPETKRKTTTTALTKSTNKRQKLANPPSTSLEPTEDEDYDSENSYSPRTIPLPLREALEKGLVYIEPTQEPDLKDVYVVVHETNDYYEGNYEKRICSVHKGLEGANVRAVEKWMREVGSDGDDELKADVIRAGRMRVVWKHEKGKRMVEVLKMKLE